MNAGEVMISHVCTQFIVMCVQVAGLLIFTLAVFKVCMAMVHCQNFKYKHNIYYVIYGDFSLCAYCINRIGPKYRPFLQNVSRLGTGVLHDMCLSTLGWNHQEQIQKGLHQHS